MTTPKEREVHLGNVQNETRGWERTLRDLNREFRRVVDALTVILEVDRQIFATAPALTDLLQIMVEGVQRLTNAHHAQILLRRGNRLEIVHSSDMPEPASEPLSFRIDECVSGLAVLTGETIISGDVKSDYPDLYKAVLGGGRGMRSELAVPIKGPAQDDDAIVVGVLNVEWPNRNAVRSAAPAIVEQFALQAGAAIHSARFRDALRITLELAQQVHSSSTRVAIRSTLTKLAAYFPQEVVVQFLSYDHDTQSLVTEASTVESIENVRILVANSFCGLVVQEQRPMFSNNVRADYGNSFTDTLGDIAGTPVYSELAVPIVDEGRIIGVLNVESPHEGAFTPHDQYLLALLANAGMWHRFRESRRTRAVESMAAVGEVAANLMHVLNNAWLPIYRRCEKAAKLAPRDESSVELKRELARLLTEVGAIGERVQDLDSKYKRAIQGNVRSNINNLVTETMNLVARDDIAITLDLDPTMTELSLPPAIADVLWNLISNANAAIPDDRPGEIRVRTRLTHGRYTDAPELLEISVSDNGVGMSTDKQATLFALGRGDRHGYGLWWIKTFVDRCEGSIRVDSTLGEGSRFDLFLPVTPEGAVRGLLQPEEQSL